MKIGKYNAEKRNNSYRVRCMKKGQKLSISFNKKPTVAMIEEAIENELAHKAACEAHKGTFGVLGQEYMDVKSEVLSPSTLRGYSSLLRNIPADFLKMQITEIQTKDIQSLINNYAKNHSAKSACNLNGFVFAVMSMYCPEKTFRITLPQKQKKDIYIPTEQDVHAVLDKIKGSKYEAAIGLMCMGLRRSEVCALTIDDLNGSEITISKAMVQNEFQEWVIKEYTKTVDSARTVTIPEYLADLIRRQGYIYKGNPGLINRYLHKVQKELGQNEYSAHKLRHFFASYCHNQLKLSDRQIESLGGWSRGSSALNTVYSHAQKQEEARQKASNGIGSLF